MVTLSQADEYRTCNARGQTLRLSDQPASNGAGQAATIQLEGGLSVTMMAIVVASLSWLWPTRTIRFQVLPIKERAYVQVAKLSGTSNLQVVPVR